MTPEQFTAARRALSTALIEALRRLFNRPGSYHQPDAAAFVQQAVPLVQGAQQSLAELTSAYLVSQASAATGRPVAPVGVAASKAVNLRRGITPDEVYQRPFTTIYTALSKGKPLADAVKLGENRLSQIAEFDLQQTYAHASRAVMAALPASVRPEFWRRTLVGTENCALCVVAATQRYHREKLNPIHPGCDCRVDPIFGEDPGQTIEPDLLEKAHAAVKELTGKSDRGARAVDYRKVTLSMTREHGELGPLLARPLNHFTGPSGI